ncbi:hypothetical protein A4X09_0g7694 [Tilletia walkeri]|uniref:Uncharacterized protein n=1 Tax=Tilletia walkeri TaxID=117179 RepID=A0A8X7T1E0_9BASI|nr:hypothetical protein A4X09_0g7694 [Tilletia walkeri]
MSVQVAGSSYHQLAPQQARPIRTWTGPDALNVSTDVIDLFVSITTPIPLVGSILAPVLSGVKNIVVIVKKSKDNKAAAEDLARRILKYVKRTAERIQDARILMDPQSTFTKTMYDLAQDLDDLLKKLGETQGHRRFRSFIDHEAIRGLIDSANVEFNDARLNQMNGSLIGLYEGRQHNSGTPGALPSASHFDQCDTSAQQQAQTSPPSQSQQPQAPAALPTPLPQSNGSVFSSPAGTPSSEMQLVARSSSGSADPVGTTAPGPSVASSSPPSSTPHSSHQNLFQQTVTEAHPYSMKVYQHSQDGVQAVLDADVDARIAEERRKKKLALHGLS